MTIPEKIQYILKVNYWTQGQLADKVGVKQTTIFAWERGRKARNKYIAKIEQLYNQAQHLEQEREQVKQKPKPLPEPKKVGKILSKRGKIVLKFPWYSYQK